MVCSQTTVERSMKETHELGVRIKAADEERQKAEADREAEKELARMRALENGTSEVDELLLIRRRKEEGMTGKLQKALTKIYEKAKSVRRRFGKNGADNTPIVPYALILTLRTQYHVGCALSTRLVQLLSSAMLRAISLCHATMMTTNLVLHFALCVFLPALCIWLCIFPPAFFVFSSAMPTTLVLLLLVLVQ